LRRTGGCHQCRKEINKEFLVHIIELGYKMIIGHKYTALFFNPSTKPHFFSKTEQNYIEIRLQTDKSRHGSGLI
jgi:hypothetical protein